MVKNPDILFRSSNFGNRGTRCIFPDNFPLCRIIIRKHKTIRQYVKLMSNRQHIFTLRLPIRFDDNKIIRVNHSVRMVQASKRIFFLIFRIYIQHNAYIFQRFNISLKFRIYLSHRGFRSDFQIFHPVIAHNTSP